jgi:poly-gamma-glutamate synthesis protein (capsule biosynthesis protein)
MQHWHRDFRHGENELKLSTNSRRRLYLTIIFAALACGCAASPTAQSPATPPAELTFAVAGDVIPHEAVRAAAAAAGPGAQGWAALLSHVSDVFQAADFGFVNMETPVAPEHSHGTKPFLFDAPLDLIAGLKLSGVKIVSFANNHVMDQGQAGFAETRQHLREQGMFFAGSGDTEATSWQPVIVEKNGIKVGFLGITRWLNGGSNPSDPAKPHVNFFPYPAGKGGKDDPPGMDDAGVLAAVRRARAQCDFLMISIHWGVEYASAPRPEDVAIAHQMLDAGATVILGHHPHVLQRMESVRTADGRNALIFFSLGNFLSNQSRDYRPTQPASEGDPRDAIIGEFSVVRNADGHGGTKVELGKVGILPVWGENNHNDLGAGRAHVPVIGPVLIDREIPLLQNPDAASQLKLLEDRRRILLVRTGGERWVTAPPKQ